MESNRYTQQSFPPRRKINPAVLFRILRLSAQSGFFPDGKTELSLTHYKHFTLKGAVETQIHDELPQLLCAPFAEAVLRRYAVSLAEFLPELLPCVHFEQYSRYHQYDVWEHTIRTVSVIRAEPRLRLAALLHDIAKPLCFSMDAAGNGHFYGHQEKSAVLAEQILHRLHYPKAEISAIVSLVRYHDVSITDAPDRVLQWLSLLGEAPFRMLLELNRADTLTHAPAAMGRLAILDREEALLSQIICSGPDLPSPGNNENRKGVST